MTVEQDPRSYGGSAFIEAYEHSAKARAKKVIDGPMYPAADVGLLRSIDPIQGAVGGASASITLLMSKSYRLISSTNCYVRFSSGASTAVAGDIFLPANVAMAIETDRWNTVSFIQVSAGGIIQAVELA